ncbi:hypothetical protein [Bacillus sp. AK128]
MKYTLLTVLAIVLLSGCSYVTEDEAKEIEEEMEQTSEIIGSELISVVDEMNQELNEAANQVQEIYIDEGEQAIIVRDVLLPLNEEGYDNLYGYIEESKYENIEQMRENGEVLYIEEQTEVEVLERDYLQARVRIESTDEEGYLPVKYLEQL